MNFLPRSNILNVLLYIVSESILVIASRPSNYDAGSGTSCVFKFPSSRCEQPGDPQGTLHWKFSVDDYVVVTCKGHYEGRCGQIDSINSKPLAKAKGKRRNFRYKVVFDSDSCSDDQYTSNGGYFDENELSSFPEESLSHISGYELKQSAFILQQEGIQEGLKDMLVQHKYVLEGNIWVRTTKSGDDQKILSRIEAMDPSIYRKMKGDIIVFKIPYKREGAYGTIMGYDDENMTFEVNVCTTAGKEKGCTYNITREEIIRRISLKDIAKDILYERRDFPEFKCEDILYVLRWDDDSCDDSTTLHSVDLVELVEHVESEDKWNPLWEVRPLNYSKIKPTTMECGLLTRPELQILHNRAKKNGIPDKCLSSFLQQHYSKGDMVVCMARKQKDNGKFTKAKEMYAQVLEYDPARIMYKVRLHKFAKSGGLVTGIRYVSHTSDGILRRINLYDLYRNVHKMRDSSLRSGDDKISTGQHLWLTKWDTNDELLLSVEEVILKLIDYSDFWTVENIETGERTETSDAEDWLRPQDIKTLYELGRKYDVQDKVGMSYLSKLLK